MTRTTSERHTDILNGYKSGGSRYNDWTHEKLGDLTLLSWRWGAISMRWDIDDRFIMPDGVMFGGHIASVADHIAGLAAMTVLTDNRERFRTSRLETNYFRPLTAPLAMIEARVTNASKTLIHVEADFKNAGEKLAVRIHAVQVRRMTG
ncbi:PaaI family thioesterase [Hyphococcus sp.]|uniref:PaaI family thioesterase n=1 Tax=Hyphococcus sp. TaxID=2038636 RepID=UPI003CCB7765